ncbi:hypothetical protein IEQ34_018006 [Dendrobium chrysotoxum]|uniref:RRM domain-containing protein n=1 Tax=Dendrobium chrysotoxum TaxID=161865 RepID=A0AAV7GD08_DENCH|nr:hypothetical protein IEQ34_018006 [Dendrobium chrysotoxum]
MRRIINKKIKVLCLLQEEAKGVWVLFLLQEEAKRVWVLCLFGVGLEAEFHLFIGCLAWAINERILEDAFKSCGEVIDAKVNNDQETGRSRGFSFIPFVMK